MHRINKVSRVPYSSGNGYIIMLTLLAMGVSLVSMHAVVLILFGMLPGLIAMIIDQESRRYISKIVLTFNCAGVFPFMAQIFSGQASGIEAVELIINPETWLVIYLSASIGWLIYWALPQLALMVNSIRMQFQIQKLNFELEKLANEWGEEIKTK